MMAQPSNGASRAAIALKSLKGGLILPVSGVDEKAWARFIHALTIDDDHDFHALAHGQRKGHTRSFSARTNAGGLGCFGIPVKRLVDLGVLKKLFVCDGKSIANPDDRRVVAFLADPLAQYAALVTSLKRYDLVISKLMLPAGMTRSGALALHHRLGPRALVKWKQHQEPSTAVLFRRANALF